MIYFDLCVPRECKQKCSGEAEERGQLIQSALEEVISCHLRELTVQREILAQYHLSAPPPGVPALACHDVFTLLLLQPQEFIGMLVNEGSNFVLHPFRNENRPKYCSILPEIRSEVRVVQ